MTMYSGLTFAALFQGELYEGFKGLLIAIGYSLISYSTLDALKPF